MNLIEESILKKYINIITTSYFPETINKNDKWNFKCNVCGDSKKSKKKKRGWILKYNGKWIYKCFNCSIVMPVKRWLKKYFPTFYSQYIKELLQHNNKKVVKKVQEDKSKVIKEDKYIKKFIPILKGNGKVFEDAIYQLKRRKILKEIWKKWYISLEGRYKNRIIIPIYDKNNMIVYWQGRSIYDQYPKYLNCLRSTEKAIISQLEIINKNKPIIILEGLIDSTFVENGLSALTSNWNNDIQKRLDELDSYYIIDFDVTNETRKKTVKLLENKKRIFNWKKYLQNNNISIEEKWDLNKLYLYEKRKRIYKFEELKEYFTNNYYDKIWFM